MAKSTKKLPSLKPYPSFPLTPHRHAKQWVKKHKGTTYYFGPLDDPDAALDRFHREWSDIIAGRTPEPVYTGDGCTIRDLCNSFIVQKRELMENGERSATTYGDHYRTCEMVLDHFGPGRIVDDLRPADFAAFRQSLAKGCNVVTLRSKINRCRVLFKYGVDNGLLDRPVAYGTAFDRPSAKSIRKARNAAGERMFEAEELRRIVDAAPHPLKAMILLGVNCGFGNSDVANLPRSAVDLSGGWVRFPRPKTEVPRRCPLWPETITAIRGAEWKRGRPKSAEDSDLMFITTRGTRFVRTQPSGRSPGKFSTINSLARRFEGLLSSLDINGGRGFYTLRHTFATIAGESTDQVAIDHIMGHVDNSMAGQYRERISDDRLRSVAESVRAWLFGAEGGAK